MSLVFFPFIQESDHTYYYVLHSTNLSITFESEISKKFIGNKKITNF